jgi:hypothetical protein
MTIGPIMINASPIKMPPKALAPPLSSERARKLAAIATNPERITRITPMTNKNWMSRGVIIRLNEKKSDMAAPFPEDVSQHR